MERAGQRGTLVLSVGNPVDGTNLTVEMANKYQKPILCLSLENEPSKSEFMVEFVRQKKSNFYRPRINRTYAPRPCRT